MVHAISRVFLIQVLVKGCVTFENLELSHLGEQFLWTRLLSTPL